MDLRKLKTLIDLVAESNITELEVTEGEEKVKIVKGGYSVAPQPMQTYAAPVAMGTAPLAASAVAPTPEATKPEGNIIKSPMVGTFYAASAPDKPDFAAVGMTVKASQTVCIIEAMKLMNEIESGFDGVITEILVANGTAVEFGQPLFVVA